MNINVDKAIPRKLSVALASLYMLKGIEPTETIKMVCIVVVTAIAMAMQWNLDKEKKNVKETNLNNPVE